MSASADTRADVQIAVPNTLSRWTPSTTFADVSRGAAGQRCRGSDDDLGSARLLLAEAAVEREEHRDDGDDRRPRFPSRRLCDQRLRTLRCARARDRCQHRLDQARPRRALPDHDDAGRDDRGRRDLPDGRRRDQAVQALRLEALTGPRAPRGSVQARTQDLGRRRTDRLRGKRLELRSRLARCREAGSTAPALGTRRRAQVAGPGHELRRRLLHQHTERLGGPRGNGRKRRGHEERIWSARTAIPTPSASAVG